MTEQNELKNWYDREYANNPRRFTRDPRYYEPFLKCLAPLPGRKILDVACGTGCFLMLAAIMSVISRYWLV